MIETNSSAFTAIATNNFPERKLESTLTTFTKIEFDKNNLFFRSTPNKISYDKVKIKNTGTTCIYFKWQKYVKPFTIPDKKSEGIDRFFCHYSDSKLFPDEERTFTFSFFSEKNGVFSEDWILVTSPPIKTANLVIHLNGMCLELKDKYSDPIAVLDEGIERRSAKTMIHEMVLDLVSTIKETDPPLPDMNDPEVFKFYFLMHNKEYK